MKRKTQKDKVESATAKSVADAWEYLDMNIESVADLVNFNEKTIVQLMGKEKNNIRLRRHKLFRSFKTLAILRDKFWQLNGKNPDGWGMNYQSIEGYVDEDNAAMSTKNRVDIMELPESLKGKTVLDIGCSLGAFCLEAKERGADRVVGLDISEDIIDKAKDIAKSKNLDIEYYAINANDSLDILKTIIGEEQFNYVFLLAVYTPFQLMFGPFKEFINIIKYYTKEILWFENLSAENWFHQISGFNNCKYLGKSMEELTLESAKEDSKYPSIKETKERKMFKIFKDNIDV